MTATLTTLATIDDANIPGTSLGALIPDSSGDLFGAAPGGGADGFYIATLAPMSELETPRLERASKPARLVTPAQGRFAQRADIPRGLGEWVKSTLC
jgi:hypothetical protein